MAWAIEGAGPRVQGSAPGRCGQRAEGFGALKFDTKRAKWLISLESSQKFPL